LKLEIQVAEEYFFNNTNTKTKINAESRPKKYILIILVHILTFIH